VTPTPPKRRPVTGSSSSSSSSSAGAAALAAVVRRTAERKALEARADLETLARSPVGHAAGVVGRIARSEDPTDQACAELARLLELELD